MSDSVARKESGSAEQIEPIEPTAVKIRNPLHGLSRDQLLTNVENFAREKELTDKLPILRKGAILAQNPHDYEHLDVLDENDKAIIRDEHTNRWSHPLTLYLTIVLCSLGAATQGWDQTGSNGANLSFPLEFGIPDDRGDNQRYHSWLIGVSSYVSLLYRRYSSSIRSTQIVNAAPYIGSAGLGCWLSDPLNNLIGRRGTIFVTAIVSVSLYLPLQVARRSTFRSSLSHPSHLPSLTHGKLFSVFDSF